MIEQKIIGCARCGGDHGPLLFEDLERPMPQTLTNVTHWARCPANGQPILLSRSEPSPSPTGLSITAPGPSRSGQDLGGAQSSYSAVGSETPKIGIAGLDPLSERIWSWVWFASFWLGVALVIAGGIIVHLGLGALLCGATVMFIAWMEISREGGLHE